MLKSNSANWKWLLVATVQSGIAYVVPRMVLKPLVTYLGLPLDSAPMWWTAVAAVISAGLVLWLMLAFRQQGASRIVSWGPVVFIAFSQLVWLLFFRGVAATGASTADLHASVSLSWPLWMLSNGLFVAAGLAGAFLTPNRDPAPPSKEWLVVSWAWIGVGLLITASAAWGILTIREILNGTGI